MYFPIGWPKYVSVQPSCESTLTCIAANRYHMLFAVVTETTISIWHCKPCVKITCYLRSSASLSESGTNLNAEWRQDSSMLAVSTKKGHLLLYQLEQDVQGEKGLVLYKYHQASAHQGDSNDSIPALRLSLVANLPCNASITSISCIHDKLLMTLDDGQIKILQWEVPVTYNKDIAVCDIPFSVDMHLSGACLEETSLFVSDAVCSPFLEGFSAVFSDGRAAQILIQWSNLGISPEKVSNDDCYVRWSAKGIWAPGISNATCTAVNNKYRLLCFGTMNGDCRIYMVDDLSGSLILSHTIALSPTPYPTLHKVVGDVLKIDWSPDGCALALSWIRGGLSVWSVFGACLACTLTSDRPIVTGGERLCEEVFYSMCWGVEGYNLWLISNHSSLKRKKSFSNKSAVRIPTGRKCAKSHVKDVEGNDLCEVSDLLQLPFLKSSLATNPCMSNHSHILMHCEDRIYLSVGERSRLVPSAKKSDRLTKPMMESNSSAYLSSTQSKSSVQGHSELHPLSERSASLNDMTTYADVNPKVVECEINNSSAEDIDDTRQPDMTCVGNKQWIVVQFPSSYLPNNWPIRFTAIDNSGCYLAVAGNFGLAHYTLASRKWKVFGNVSQEKDMVVTGGLTWWEDFLVVACYSLSSGHDELRIYPRYTNLDNAFACIHRINSQILLVNVFQNFVILFTYDSQISLFVLRRDNTMPVPVATLHHLQDLSIACYVPYPTLVVSVTMTSLHMESAARRIYTTSTHSYTQRVTKVIIVNIAGRLLLLQQSPDDDAATPPTSNTTNTDMAPPQQHDVGSTTIHQSKKMCFSSPVVLASCVENIWTTEYKNSDKIHLTDALWIGCGNLGVRVWLPLFPPANTQCHRPTITGHQRANSMGGGSGAAHHHSSSSSGLELQLLTSRRITLTFALDVCYPLSVVYDKAVVLGVTAERWQYQNVGDQSASSSSAEDQPHFGSCLQFFYSVDQNCDIFLQQILCQLLRRNLGYHALQLANTCTALTCFPHVLELMLHEVLEEEATASEPIPDPLLPTVIKFIAEFPEYHMTVVHCARKTEIALWEYLFNYVGSPKELFEECLQFDQLETAASYLIILQNLELLAVARQDATRLFDRALQKQCWSLANEIVRFLRAIGDGDATATPRHPTLMNTNIYPAVSPPAYSVADTENGFKFSKSKSSDVNKTTANVALIRSDSVPSTQPYVISQHSVRKFHQDHPPHRALHHSSSVPLSEGGMSLKRLSTLGKDKMIASECAEHYFIDVILARQARKMLSERRLKALGMFAAHIDFQLVPWLKKERNRAARVDDAVQCLCSLHADFEWPYPSQVSTSGKGSSRNSVVEGVLLKNFATSLHLSSNQLIDLNCQPRGLPSVKCPQNPHNDAISITSYKERSEMSDSGYAVIDPNFFSSAESFASELDGRSYQLDPVINRGSTRAEMQMRYLLELMLESFCLEWALLIGILFHEPTSIQRLVNSARAAAAGSSSQSDDLAPAHQLGSLQRLRTCLLQITRWAESECRGYKRILYNLEEDLNKLRDIINDYEVQHAEHQAILANKKMASNTDSKAPLSRLKFQDTEQDDSSIDYGVADNTMSLTTVAVDGGQRYNNDGKQPHHQIWDAKTTPDNFKGASPSTSKRNSASKHNNNNNESQQSPIVTTSSLGDGASHCVTMNMSRVRGGSSDNTTTKSLLSVETCRSHRSTGESVPQHHYTGARKHMSSDEGSEDLKNNSRQDKTNTGWEDDDLNDNDVASSGEDEDIGCIIA